MQSILFTVFSNFASDLSFIFLYFRYLLKCVAKFFSLSLYIIDCISLDIYQFTFSRPPISLNSVKLFSQISFPFSSIRFFHVFRQVYLSASLSVSFQLTPCHLGARCHVVFCILKENLQFYF